MAISCTEKVGINPNSDTTPLLAATVAVTAVVLANGRAEVRDKTVAGPM